MIDKYRLDDLRLESGEKGELARWVIQLQTDLDSERHKDGNSPVVPDFDTWFYSPGRGINVINGDLQRDLQLKAWNACRAAMLQSFGNSEQLQNAQQNIPEIIPGGLVEAVNNLLNNDGSRGCYSAMGCGAAREKIELWLAQRQKWDTQRNENLSTGNSPVIPDGYVLVPKEPTDEMIVAAMDSDDVTYNDSDDTVFYVHHREIYKAMVAAAPQQEGKGE